MKWWQVALFLVLVSCAGTQRSCASSCAESYGADWMIVQYANDGKPLACWKLSNVSVTNEKSSDGVYWLDNHTGNLVHISGWYNRVQVSGGNWEHAAKNLGVVEKHCHDGTYIVPKPAKEPAVETDDASTEE